MINDINSGCTVKTKIRKWSLIIVFSFYLMLIDSLLLRLFERAPSDNSFQFQNRFHRRVWECICCRLLVPHLLSRTITNCVWYSFLIFSQTVRTCILVVQFTFTEKTMAEKHNFPVRFKKYTIWTLNITGRRPVSLGVQKKSNLNVERHF